LGKWLYDQCIEYGVSINCECNVVNIQLDNGRHLQSVEVKCSSGCFKYDCDNLIFAAGPRTGPLIKKMIPQFNHNLHETVNSGNWITVKADLESEDQIRAEVILDSIVGHQLEFVSRQDLATNEFVIWICGLNNETSPIGKVGERTEPDEEAIKKLIKYAREYLSNPESTKRGPQVLERGRNYRPTIDRDFPILAPILCAEVSNPDVSRSSFSSGRRNEGHSGIWVCTGHGKYGVSLAMGSGKLMSQMVLGKKTDLDVSMLGFPS